MREVDDRMLIELLKKSTVAMVTTLTATPIIAVERNRWYALSIDASTPERLTAMMLGISQRVIRIATPICGAGNPWKISGTYHGAAK
jgi:hypothetical protein